MEEESVTEDRKEPLVLVAAKEIVVLQPLELVEKETAVLVSDDHELNSASEALDEQRHLQETIRSAGQEASCEASRPPQQA
jgi:hypothetical protein